MPVLHDWNTSVVAWSRVGEVSISFWLSESQADHMAAL